MPHSISRSTTKPNRQQSKSYTPNYAPATNPRVCKNILSTSILRCWKEFSLTGCCNCHPSPRNAEMQEHSQWACWILLQETVLMPVPQTWNVQQSVTFWLRSINKTEALSWRANFMNAFLGLFSFWSCFCVYEGNLEICYLLQKSWLPLAYNMYVNLCVHMQYVQTNILGSKNVEKEGTECVQNLFSDTPPTVARD